MSEETGSPPGDVNVVTHILDDLNLHCTDHAPDADCEGCRLQVETHVEALEAERAALLAALKEIVAEMRTIQMVAGQCAVEGAAGLLADMSMAESERTREWADKIEALADGRART